MDVREESEGIPTLAHEEATLVSPHTDGTGDI